MYRGPEGIALSGVGSLPRIELPNPAWGRVEPPRHRHARWSDSGHSDELNTSVALVGRTALSDRYGFIFHEACWALLEGALHPAPVPLERLFELCASLPVSRTFGGTSWGHDYGGIAVLDNTCYFPWESRLRMQPRENLQLSAAEFSKNPYLPSEIARILDEHPEEPPAPRHSFPPPDSTPALTESSDCFARLPEELCAAIAMRLPTTDVLNARLASRSFWFIFHSQQFWASRFKGPSAERPWLLDVREPTLRSNVSRDWCWLYRRAGSLQNRQRIWGLIRGVVDLVSLVWNELPLDLAPMWSAASILSSGPDLVEATADLQAPAPHTHSPSSHFQRGCRKSRSQTIAIPDTLARLSVSTVAVGDDLFVAGLCLTTTAGDTVRLGYYSHSDYSVNLSEIWGVRLAVGASGMHALQCITGPTGLSPDSPWLGSYPSDSLVTDRLAIGRRAVALEVGFDVRTPFYYFSLDAHQLPVEFARPVRLTSA